MKVQEMIDIRSKCLNNINYYRSILNSIDSIEYNDSFTSREVLNASIKTVIKYYQITKQELFSNRRFRELVIARQVVFFLVRKNSSMYLQEIADVFNKNHATVIHSINTIQNLIEVDRSFAKEINEIEIMFNDLIED